MWTSTPLLWFLLRWVGWLLLLAGCLFGLLSVTIRPVRKWTGMSLRLIAPFKLYVLSRLIVVLSTLPSVTRFVTRFVPVVAALAVGFYGGRTWQDTQWPTYQYKWVTVKSQTDADTFHLVLPQGIEVVAKFCKPVPPLVPGVIMEVFTYQERPDCMFVGKDELIKYHRDSADNVVDAYGHELYAKGAGQ